MEIAKGKGTFEIHSTTKILVSTKDHIEHAELLAEGLGLLGNVSIGSGNPPKTENVIFLRTNDAFTEKNDGYYEINISDHAIDIVGSDKSALIGAVYRLIQLRLLQEVKTVLPAVKIKDYPRFGYRGLHLDVSRHFFPIAFLEKLIDMMALYQLNTFHWHLTDGPGWRLEIKSFPNLTKKAAFRTHKTWKDWWASERKYLNEGDPQAYGGYYTQEEARKLVEYAEKRGVTIMPEIEMPGHSEEVLAVYPELACSGEAYTQSEFCMGNEATFDFLEKVLAEVMDVFPSEYIHIGGDEANKSAWKKCPKCQKRIVEEHLENEDELQSYGVRRIERFLSSHGRKLVGWDEILEGGLAPGATVMSWRGETGGIEAAHKGHEVIMTPGSHCYFDSYQSDPVTQPEAIGGYLPIEKVYSYEPVPEELNGEQRKLVKGVQANLWTEYIPTVEHLEYMIFPRLLALSEVAWSSRANKNWEDFFRRLQQHYRLLQRKGVNYYRPSLNLAISAMVDTSQKASMVVIKSERYRPIIRYTTDGSLPDASSTLYRGPFYEKGIKTVKAAIQPSKDAIGPIFEREIGFHKAIGCEVTYLSPYSDKYPAKADYSLVNGVQGGFTYSDGQWQGFEGNDMDVLIDLESEKWIEKVKVTFMQLTGPGVFLPGEVEISISTDGVDFSTPIIINHTVSGQENSLKIHPFESNIDASARFIRLKAANSYKGFLFVDEIIVY